MRAKLLSAAVVLTLAAPAYAQVNILAPNIKYKTQEEVDQATSRDQDYKNTMRKLPDQKTSSDPWGNVRGAGTAQTEVKPKPKKKPAAQP